MPKGPRATTRRHDWIDERSLALSHAAAEKLRADPTLISLAHQRLDAWEASARAQGDNWALSAWGEWRDILHTYAFDDLLYLLGEDRSERAIRLRQSRPFVGILTAEERDVIMRQFEEM